MKKLLVLLLGWSFIVLGVVGLFLPFLQGILFLLIGLFLVSSEYAWARRILDRLRSRFPSLACRYDEAAQRACGAFARLSGCQPDTVRLNASKASQATTRDSDSRVEDGGAPAGPRREAEGTGLKPSGAAEQAVKFGSLPSGVANDSAVTVSGGANEPNKAHGCAEGCGTH